MDTLKIALGLLHLIFFNLLSVIVAQYPVAPVRLVNGSRCSGRVEIFYGGEWGTICDDGWDTRDAEVVCHQLGCGHSVSAPINAEFGQGEGQIMLDNVQCRGHEDSLIQCSHQGIKIHNCAHTEDAGVVCSETTTPTTATTTPSSPGQTCNGFFTDDSGLISKVLYPSYNNSWCTWVIKTNSSKYVTLRFNYINMGNLPACNVSGITIYDGYPWNAKVIGRICRKPNVDFASSSNIMTIQYFNDDPRFVNDFEAQYYTRNINNAGIETSLFNPEFAGK
ncbi:putative DMBT1-like protein [Leptodactylus fuscus]|uniref:putative DMBT1-like protein n=1 Tax=Leptodactylus fuscus TaxID=238119 RepID=UPI003F4E78A6